MTFRQIGLAFAVTLLLCAGSASGGPLVFDFEDGLQGWTPTGSARWVNTQILGGQWAIFGDGLSDEGASISIQIDLTDVASISLHQFFGGDETVGTSFLGFLIFPLDQPQENPQVFGGLLTASPDQDANPGLRVLTLNGAPFQLEGVHEVRINWSDGSVIIDPPRPPSARLLGFVDNITFHPIPEPGHLGLIGLTALLWIKKGRKSGSSRDTLGLTTA